MTHRDLSGDLAESISGTVKALLDVRLWLAFDIDDDGRVLAGHDDLGSLQLVEIAPDGTTTELTDLPSRCAGRYVPGRRQVLVEHDSGGDEKWQISLLDLSAMPASPVGLDDLTPVVRDAEHMNVLHDVTSTSLIYSTNRRNEVDMDIVVRDLDSGEETVVFDDGGYVVQTSVSHDESSVAVTALSLQPNGTVVSLAGPLGSGALTSPDEHANHHVVGWAADDDGVLVASDHDRDHHAVWHVDLEGTWRVLVEDDEHDLGAAASRDGSCLLVSHHVDGLDVLAIHEADGRHRVDVDLGPVVPLSVRWADDGSRFVLTAMTPVDPGSILSVDATTGAVTQLVDGRATAAGRAAGPAGDPDRAPHPDARRRAGAVLPVRGGVPGRRTGRGFRRARARRSRVRGDPDVLGRVAVAGDGRLRRAGAQRARLGGVRQALGLPRRPRAPPRLGGGPGGHPRLAAVGRARRVALGPVGWLVRRVHGARRRRHAAATGGPRGSTSSGSRRW